MQISKIRDKSKFRLMERFPLTSEQLEILVAFESTDSLAKLGALIGRDVSVASRHLSRIAQLGPYLGKNRGKWYLTAAGKEVCSVTKEFRRRLILASEHKIALRIGTTREFAARMLVPELTQILGKENKYEVSIHSVEEGVEPLLLSGAIDIGVDCGRPFDPLIRFQQVCREEFIIVASPSLCSASLPRSIDDLIRTPCLEYNRMKVSRYLELPHELSKIAYLFNDLAATRAAAVAGLGWAIVPRYAVESELRSKQLVRVANSVKIRSDHFGVWWLRTNATLKPFVERVCVWLKSKSL